MFSKDAAWTRTLRVAVPLGVIALALTGCSESSGGGAAGGSGNVAAIIKGLDNPFFQAMEDGINDTADADGVDVTVQAAADVADTTGQADKLTTLAALERKVLWLASWMNTCSTSAVSSGSQVRWLMSV
jgi:ABC-type sugar transport system substrate-binding protein